ncbi:substrate-binding domain-containing protein [Limimaricola cinnabarinus]|uniref:substrate-binding domain-containing protein n=1 Tax=Limimaricola cinnabarinus TaxID=1125964 RepID=UPI0013A66BA5
MISASDQLAIALASTLDARGLRVPDDVSLIGFNDIQTADFVFPPLTTVRQDRLRLGAQAAALLLRQLAGGQLCLGQSCHAASVASGPGNDVRPQRERLTGDRYSRS